MKHSHSISGIAIGYTATVAHNHSIVIGRAAATEAWRLPEYYYVGWFMSMHGLKATGNHVFLRGDPGLTTLCNRQVVDRHLRITVSPVDAWVDCAKCRELSKLAPLEWLARA